MLKRLDRGWDRRGAVIGGVMLVATGVLDAHGPPVEGGVGMADGSIWRAWTFPALVTINLCLFSGLYAWGVARIWTRAGKGSVVSPRQAMAFAAGMAVLVVALISPVDALSDELSAMHMIQHMLLMNVAAPLLVLGAPGMAVFWVLPLHARRKLGGWKRVAPPGRALQYLLWQPLLLWSLFALVLWIWHLPSLYEATLRNNLFHDFQHLTFLVAASLFWRVLLDPISRMRLSRVATVLYLFFTSLHATLLGVFMALAPAVWYPTYQGRTTRWSLSALEDQQLAGLIMWMPACMVYAIVVALVLAFWLNDRPEPLPFAKGETG